MDSITENVRNSETRFSPKGWHFSEFWFQSISWIIFNHKQWLFLKFYKKKMLSMFHKIGKRYIIYLNSVRSSFDDVYSLS